MERDEKSDLHCLNQRPDVVGVIGSDSILALTTWNKFNKRQKHDNNVAKKSFNPLQLLNTTRPSLKIRKTTSSF